MYEKCYYSHAEKNIITFPNPDKPGMDMYRSTIAELQTAYPDMELMDTKAATKLREGAFVSPPEIITEDQYDHALEVLPPENWHDIDCGEYFQMMEYVTGNITNYYVSHNGRFFSFADEAWMQPAQIQSIINDFLTTEAQ